MSECPFCRPDETRLCYQGRLVFALWDGFPVSPGHCLVIPRRHVASWWDATDEEMAEMSAATREVKRLIEERHAPDGYNIGVNAGEAAGQSVWHLHLHVIPRYRGDVAEARGGVRNIVPHQCGPYQGYPAYPP
jgi:diadenosine tetraphosphate (Ap4A) HIT family hydrolase